MNNSPLDWVTSAGNDLASAAKPFSDALGKPAAAAQAAAQPFAQAAAGVANTEQHVDQAAQDTSAAAKSTAAAASAWKRLAGGVAIVGAAALVGIGLAFALGGRK